MFLKRLLIFINKLNINIFFKSCFLKVEKSAKLPRMVESIRMTKQEVDAICDEDINEVAIKAGALIPNSQPFSHDHFSHLGDNLTCHERKCYYIISKNVFPISSKTISQELYENNSGYGEDDRASVCALVRRIRNKLGKNAIKKISKKGYVSRRVQIMSGQMPPLD